MDAGVGYGRNTQMAGTNINLEFVSANPTGPIHLGGTLTTHEVLITNDAGQRLCTLRITNLLMKPKE